MLACRGKIHNHQNDIMVDGLFAESYTQEYGMVIRLAGNASSISFEKAGQSLRKLYKNLIRIWPRQFSYTFQKES